VCESAGELGELGLGGEWGDGAKGRVWGRGECGAGMCHNTEKTIARTQRLTFIKLEK